MQIVRRTKRRIFGLAALTLLIVFAASAGRLLVVDAPERADVILVLAGETDRRPARALELLDQGYGQAEIIDVPATAKIYNLTQVQLAEQYIHGLSQPAKVRVCAITGLSTRDEAHDVKQCLAKDENRVLIVTSEFHSRRALSIFRHELAGKTFSVAVARDDTQFGVNWWAHRQWAKTCFDEWSKLLWWTLVDRWR